MTAAQTHALRTRLYTLARRHESQGDTVGALALIRAIIALDSEGE